MLKLTVTCGTSIENACKTAAKIARSLPLVTPENGDWYCLEICEDVAVLRASYATPAGEDPAAWETESAFRALLREQCLSGSGYAIVVVVEGPEGVCFDFNDIHLEHAASKAPVGDIAQALHTQREEKSQAASDAYWTPERKAEQARREVRAVAARGRQQAKVKHALAQHPFEASDVEAWVAFKDTNSRDLYSAGVVAYAESWAALMTEAHAAGAEICNVAEELARVADVDGITGFMHGAAVQALSAWWIHGKEIARLAKLR